jgi:hypothetical protein
MTNLSSFICKQRHRFAGLLALIATTVFANPDSSWRDSDGGGSMSSGLAFLAVLGVAGYLAWTQGEKASKAQIELRNERERRSEVEKSHNDLLKQLAENGLSIARIASESSKIEKINRVHRKLIDGLISDGEYGVQVACIIDPTLKRKP